MKYVDNLPFNGAFPWQPVRLPAWNSVAACCLGAVLIDRFIWNHRGFQLRHFFRLGDWRSGDIWRYLERPEEFHWFSRPGNQGTCFINLSFEWRNIFSSYVHKVPKPIHFWTALRANSQTHDCKHAASVDFGVTSSEHTTYKDNVR